MLIRRETPDDVDAIDAVHRAAFATVASEGDTPEALLVRRLRVDRGWVAELSLVAEDSAGAVVGHVVGTVGAIDATPVLGIGPLGVLPTHQGRGVGSALMHAVLAAADARDHPVVVLLGSVEYYRRFGFVAASTIGIVAPEVDWGDHFQARRLSTWNAAPTGRFRYATPFEEL